jgi:ribosomal protein S18 acetylase RimI-like enzyme
VSADELARIVAMSRWAAAATATRVEPWRFGSAIFTDDFPRRYDSNFLRVDVPIGDATAADLATEADAVQSSLLHRELVFEDAEDGARVAPGFRELGYLVDEAVVMVQREDVAADGDVVAFEVDADRLRPIVVATRLENAATTVQDAEMLADFRVVAAERAGTRYFAAELDGVLASYCELRAHDGLAQIEDVNTLAAWRNRGAGRAVVLAAAAAARAARADLVWLAADADDWPQQLYAKLGFLPVGRTWQCTRLAPDHPALRDAAGSAP